MDAMTKSINWLSIIGSVIIGGLTAWFIYNRYKSLCLSRFNESEISSTLARSRELEAEVRNSVRSLSTAGDEFRDDPDDPAAAAILRNDHIDFLDREDSQVEYEDEFRDDEDDNGEEEERVISNYADRDQEGAIGLNKHTAKK